MDEEKFYCEQLEEEAKLSDKNFHPFLIFALVIFTIMVLIVTGTFIWMNKPEKIMKDYFRNLSSGKWNRIYDQLYFDEEEDKFLTKELFISARKLEEISNKKNHWSMTGMEIVEGKSDFTRKNVEVNYKKNESEFRKEFVLVRKGFGWKIDGQEYVQHNIAIHVPKGTELQFDKVLLSKEDQVSVKEEMDTYVLPSIFGGTHYITAEKKGRESYEELLSFKDKEVLEIDMNFQHKVLEEITDTVVNELKQSYEEKIKDKKIKKRFEFLSLKNNKISVVQTGVNEVEISISSDYEYRYKEKKQKKVTITGQCINRLTYERKNDEFHLTEVDLEDGFL